jgi:hypothetical protein
MAVSLRQLLGKQRKCMDGGHRLPWTRMTHLGPYRSAVIASHPMRRALCLAAHFVSNTGANKSHF